MSRTCNIQVIRWNIGMIISVDGPFAKPANGWTPSHENVVFDSTRHVINSTGGLLLLSAENNADELPRIHNYRPITAEVRIDDSSIRLELRVSTQKDVEHDTVKGILLNTALPNILERLKQFIQHNLHEDANLDRLRLIVDGKPISTKRLLAGRPIYAKVPAVRDPIPVPA